MLDDREKRRITAEILLFREEPPGFEIVHGEHWRKDAVMSGSWQSTREYIGSPRRIPNRKATLRRLAEVLERIWVMKSMIGFAWIRMVFPGGWEVFANVHIDDETGMNVAELLWKRMSDPAGAGKRTDVIEL